MYILHKSWYLFNPTLWCKDFSVYKYGAVHRIKLNFMKVNNNVEKLLVVDQLNYTADVHMNVTVINIVHDPL